MNTDSRILLFWSTVRGLRYPTLRDREGNLLEPFTSYLHSVVQKSADGYDQGSAKSEIDAATYSVKGFVEFLLGRRRRLPKVDDQLLREFKTHAFRKIRRNPSSLGRARTAAESTNIKLRHVYHLLKWCQENRRIPQDTIGVKNCRVLSSLPEEDGADARRFSNKLKYPLSYRRIGEKTRVDESQYWATEEDIRILAERFREGNGSNGSYCAERNILLLRLGEYEGWRVGSSVSLTIDQFSDKAFQEQANADAFEVCPPDQKLGYQFSFSMPWPLANFIKNVYIETIRKHHMTTHGITEDTAQSRIFLSATTGKPLRPKSVSSIFSSALRALGRPKRAAYHAFRRYKAQKIAEEIIERRMRDGTSLAKDDVIDEIARALGHSTREAQRAYLRANKKCNLQSVEERQRDEIAALQLEIAQVRARNVTLERELNEALRLAAAA